MEIRLFYTKEVFSSLFLGILAQEQATQQGYKLQYSLNYN